MKLKLRSIATPLTIASFVGVAVTGLSLLLGVRGGLVTPVHEISSIFFVIGSVLHIAVNGKATLSHLRPLRGKLLLLPFALLALVALLPIGNSGGKGPMIAVGRSATGLLQNATLGEIAQLSHRPGEELLGALRQGGLNVGDTSATVNAIASANQQEPLAVLNMILPTLQDAKDPD